nr:family 43 glycosylhydrolase [Clostridia bacterium]
MKRLFCVVFFAVLLSLAVLAKETVIYENDFSSSDLSDFTMYGNMVVVGGRLKASGGEGPSAYVAYTFPEKYQGMDYIVEVDYLGHNNHGGLIIGATSDDLDEVPKYFSGYGCNVYRTTGTICYFAGAGWGGEFAKVRVSLEHPDLHLSVRVLRGVMTWSVYKLGEDTPIYVSRYEPGDGTGDIYKTFTSTVGIRQYYADKGSFDNFKVTVLTDDELPPLSKTVTFGGATFASNGITVDKSVASGNGAMLTKAIISGDFRTSFKLAANGVTRFYFGMTDEKNGYAFEINKKETAVFLYKIKDGVYSLLGEKENIIREDFCKVTLDIHDGITSIFYDNYYQNGSEFPKFEFPLQNTDGELGFWLEGGSVKDFTVGESEITLPEETYLNPVNPGADPDVLYWEGTYYLYVYSGNDGKNIFRVYTSPDLVHFTERNIVFTWDDKYIAAQAGSSWSPNVSYYDGKFYLFFAAKRAGVDQRSVFYATADSPYGPFTFDGPLEAVNPNRHNEIDGHPFYDEDGKIYMSFSRYDCGGTIWLEEVEMAHGRVIQKPETDTRVIIPDREWDNDGGTGLCEGGYIWKHEGYYYLIYATVKYDRHYGEAYAVSENPLGPYVKYDFNPIVTHNYMLDGPGDALIVPSPDGKELYMVYHRHNAVGKVHLRQTCIDLIEFVDDPDNPDGPDILTVRGPSSTPQKMPSNIYRYDVDRDGYTTIKDVQIVLEKYLGRAQYSGYYDVDASGTVNLYDAIILLKKAVE